MSFLRRLLVAFCAVVFFFASINLAWSHVFVRSLANRDVVKSWLDDGKFYDNIVDVVIENLSTVESDKAGEIPVTDPVLQAKVKEVITPQFLQTSTESILDGVYNWLEGKTDKPDFAIDLSGIRTSLATALGDYAVARGANLPVCSEVPADYDAISAECIPPGVVAADLKAQVENTLLNESTFIDKPTLTADTITSNDGQSNLFVESEKIQKFYNQSKNLPLILGILTALSAIGVLFLSSSRRSGFLRLGILSTVTAVVLGLGFMALAQAPKVFQPDIVNDQGAQNKAAQELITNMFEIFARDNKKLIAIYAVSFALVATACYVAYVTLGRRDGEEGKGGESKEPKPPIDDSPKQEAKKAETEKPKDKDEKPIKPAKPPTKIQL
jgi:hypothetical protein